MSRRFICAFYPVTSPFKLRFQALLRGPRIGFKKWWFAAWVRFGSDTIHSASTLPEGRVAQGGDVDQGDGRRTQRCRRACRASPSRCTVPAGARGSTGNACADVAGPAFRPQPWRYGYPITKRCSGGARHPPGRASPTGGQQSSEQSTPIHAPRRAAPLHHPPRQGRSRTRGL